MKKITLSKEFTRSTNKVLYVFVDTSNTTGVHWKGSFDDNKRGRGMARNYIKMLLEEKRVHPDEITVVSGCTLHLNGTTEKNIFI